MNGHYPKLTEADLGAYLERIDYQGDLRPSADVLAALHLAHVSHIPFENLDILLGRAIHLDLDSLVAKLVRGDRGGYCFEQNLLFAAVLDALGFTVTQLAARVRYQTQRVLARTHMLLAVECENNTWLADVGFGAEGLLLPLLFVVGQECRQFGWSYRVVRENERWVLQGYRDGSWMDLYAFTLEPQELVDYEVANYYVSTHPDSRFTQTLTAQLSSPEVRYTLRNLDFSIVGGDRITTRSLTGQEELITILDYTFNLRFPPWTRFQFREPVP